MKLAAFMMCVLAGAAASPGGVLWNEMSQGDLSNDRFAPTPFVLSPEDNFLFGITGGNPGAGDMDPDYFSIKVPNGYQLAQLVLDFYSSADQVAFMGIQPGGVFPNDPATVSPDDLMGWMHFGPSQIGEDLLPLMGANGSGFTPPLPAGTYSFWVQQLDDYTDWTGNFVVTEVPAPSSGVVMLLVGVRAIRRRRV